MIEVNKIPDSPAVSQKYLELLAQGKERGFTPVLTDRKRYLPYDLRRYGLDETEENLPKYREALMREVCADDYSVWHKRMIEEFFLDGCVGDEDRRHTLERMEPLSDEEYRKITDPLEIVSELRITKDDIYYHYPTYVGPEDVVIVLIPTTRPYEALAWLPMGGGNWCPYLEYQIALAKHLYEEYGAIVMAIWGIAIEYYIPEPLVEKSAVEKAARDLIPADSDIFDEMSTAVQILYGQKHWILWWD